MGPFAVYKGTTPDGWQGNQNSPLNEIRMDFYKCQRLSWGPIERGPVYTVHEWTANFQDPAKCMTGAQNRKVLESIGFSDPGVVEFARNAGMNAYLANFTFSHMQVAPGAGLQWTATWTPSGAAPSQVIIADPAMGFNSTNVQDTRLYWSNGPGISFMDFHASYQASDLPNGAAEGELSAPMVWGRSADPHFASSQENLEGQATFSGSISRFSDKECTKPL